MDRDVWRAIVSCLGAGEPLTMKERGLNSVVAKGTIMRAPSSIYHHRTLYARKGREGEMANPENKVRPFIHGKALAYSCYYSLFEMETTCLV